MSDARIILAKPGDLLLIGNLGTVDPDSIRAAAPLLTEIKERFQLAGILLFENDIDLATVQPRDLPAEVVERVAASRLAHDL